MNDLHSLIRAAYHTSDRTPVAMLADHLMEQGDGRGDILRRGLENLGHPENERTTKPGEDAVGHADSLGTDLEEHPTGLNTLLRKSAAGNPYFAVRLRGSGGGEVWNQPGVFGGLGPKYGTEVSHTEARHLADHLPEADQFHHFLNTHFGPDPRTQKYARAYVKALNGCRREEDFGVGLSSQRN